MTTNSNVMIICVGSGDMAVDSGPAVATDSDQVAATNSDRVTAIGSAVIRSDATAA